MLLLLGVLLGLRLVCELGTRARGVRSYTTHVGHPSRQALHGLEATALSLIFPEAIVHVVHLRVIGAIVRHYARSE